jgi:hypothetical protein
MSMQSTEPKAPMMATSFTENKPGLPVYFTLLGILFVLRVLVGVVQVPVAVGGILGLILNVAFIVTPIVAIYIAARDRWEITRCGIFLGAGILLHVGAALLGRNLAPGMGQTLISAVGNTGLILWCTGLGGMIACLIKDKNMILPVAIFLAGFDIFVVTYPSGPVQQILQKNPEVFKKVAYSVPSAAVEGSKNIGLNIAGYVGPADFFFLAMFFILLTKFSMKYRETLPYMVGALVFYLLVVLFAGNVSIGPISLGALPALVPIGAVVLAVNRKEFSLKGEELIGTIVVAVIAFGLAAFGIISAGRQQAMPIAPAQPVDAQGTQGSAAMPEPMQSGQSQ